jgi:hypothetical protein
MSALLSKLAEIVATFGTRFLDSRNVARDAVVAGHLVGIVVALQDLCGRGRRILGLAGGFADGTVDERHAAEFDVLLMEQDRAVRALQHRLLTSRELLATIDARLSLELAPLLDDKSGLLTRWSQQVEQSRFSTTTLFFVPADSLQRLLEIGTEHSSPRGLDRQRDDYVLALADQLRATRSRELRDMRRATGQGRKRLKAEITTALAELGRAEELCANLLTAAEQALGAAPFAALRRKLVPKPRLS